MKKDEAIKAILDELLPGKKQYHLVFEMWDKKENEDDSEAVLTKREEVETMCDIAEVFKIMVIRTEKPLCSREEDVEL
jgi:hypothetical protein